MEKVERKRATKKVKVYTKMQTFLTKYTTVIVCDIKDMPANNIHKMRKELRSLDSEVLCGKASVMVKSVEEYISQNENKLPSHHQKDTLVSLANLLNGHQFCLLFTNKDLGEITKITEQYKIEKQSKVGALSPIEIILPAGPTGMDASQIEYFQNLRIQTKVMKNQLEIISDTKILVVGQKITLSEINLMNKFNIKPFKHKIHINNIILSGKLFDAGILNINEEVMKRSLDKAISNLAAFGLATGISNKASAPHSIANSFRNIIGLSFGTGVEVKQAKNLQAATTVTAPVTTAPAKKEEPKKEEKKDDKKKEAKKVVVEDDDDFGGPLF